MEPLQNKDLRKVFLFTVFLGSLFGCLYVFVLQQYFFEKPALNIEILEQLNILANGVSFNSTGKVDNKHTWDISRNIEFGTNVEKRKKQGYKKNSNSNDELHAAKHEKKGGIIDLATNEKNKKNSEPLKAKTKGNNKEICTFNKTNLGIVFLDENPPNLVTLRDQELPFVESGGRWSPSDCIPRAELAVVIPYRKREKHRGIFLRHMHKFLKKQMVSYRIFVIEQDDEFEFNRGKLMNVGFKEAMKRHKFTCFAFHDIDLLPEDLRNDYACPKSPRHVSVAIDKFNYKLLYEELFGGVEMFSTGDFESVNGFSNSFWGWGAEDDNLYFRIKSNNMRLSRPSLVTGRYKMLKHLNMEPYAAPERREILGQSKNMRYTNTDGLSSLQYKEIRVLELPLFTLIKVNLQKHKDKLFGVLENL